MYNYIVLFLFCIIISLLKEFSAKQLLFDKIWTI